MAIINLDRTHFNRLARGYTMGRNGFELDWGEYVLREPIEVGDGSAGGSVVSLAFHGQGKAGVASSTGKSYGATMIRPHRDLEGHPMFVLNGTPWLDLKNVGFRPDSEDGAYASACVVLTGDNVQGGPTFLPSLENVCFDSLGGAHAGAPQNQAVGLDITGAQYKDQVDGVLIRHCSFYRLHTGILQRNQQTVQTRLVSCNFGNFQKNVEVRDGSLTAEGCLFQMNHYDRAVAEKSVGVHLTKNPPVPFACAQNVTLRDCDFEMKFGRFYVAETGGAHKAYRLENCTFKAQHPENAEMTIVDSDSAGPLHIASCRKEGDAPALIRKTRGKLSLEESSWGTVRFEGDGVPPELLGAS